VVAWILFLGVVGGGVLFGLEGAKVPVFDCFFLSLSTVTAAGLSTISVPDLSSASLFTLVLLALLGNVIVISLLPVVVRMSYLKRHIPLDFRTFDLNNFQKASANGWRVVFSYFSAAFEASALGRVPLNGLCCHCHRACARVVVSPPQVPLWVVEYKSLQLIVRIVCGYMAFFYTAGFIALYASSLGFGGKMVGSLSF